MTKEQFVKEVVKKLKCSGAKRKEIGKQIQADIAGAIENGESMESIMETMGTPESIANEFNENMTEEERKACRRTKYLKIAGIVVVLLVAIGYGIYWYLPKGYTIEDSKGFEKQQVQEQTKNIIEMFMAEDIAGLKEVSVKDMQTFWNTTSIADIKKQVFGAESVGEVQDFGEFYTAEMEQMGKRMAVTEVSVSYEKRTVVYTVTLDRDLKLTGLWLR